MTIRTPPVFILLMWPDKAIVIREKLLIATVTSHRLARAGGHPQGWEAFLSPGLNSYSCCRGSETVSLPPLLCYIAAVWLIRKTCWTLSRSKK